MYIFFLLITIWIFGAIAHNASYSGAVTVLPWVGLLFGSFTSKIIPSISRLQISILILWLFSVIIDAILYQNSTWEMIFMGGKNMLLAFLLLVIPWTLSTIIVQFIVKSKWDNSKYK